LSASYSHSRRSCCAWASLFPGLVHGPRTTHPVSNTHAATISGFIFPQLVDLFDAAHEFVPRIPFAGVAQDRADVGLIAPDLPRKLAQAALLLYQPKQVQFPYEIHIHSSISPVDGYAARL
jgi:hypothetical protein